MRRVVIFTCLLVLKTLSRIFYRIETTWVGQSPQNPFSQLRLVLLINHTSLFEPIFLGIVPISVLWQMAEHAVIPVADITYDRPLARFLISMLGKSIIPISRKRDHTWAKVLKQTGPRSMIWMAPEGRMKRPNGLDRHGKPMTIKGGVADILQQINSGAMLIGYSGGLHHVQIPGSGFPKLFKTIRLNLEQIEISKFKEEVVASKGSESIQSATVSALTKRKEKFLPASVAS